MDRWVWWILGVLQGIPWVVHYGDSGSLEQVWVVVSAEGVGFEDIREFSGGDFGGFGRATFCRLFALVVDHG